MAIIWVTWKEVIKINIFENLSTALCRADIKLAERFSLHQLQHQPPNTQTKIRKYNKIQNKLQKLKQKIHYASTKSHGGLNFKI